MKGGDRPCERETEGVSPGGGESRADVSVCQVSGP